jgi:hypothetical protein
VNVREDGTFEYPGAADGHYSFTAMAPGYLGGEKVQLTIREADGDQRLDLPLLRGVTVRVTVLDPAGNPLSGATVLSDFAQNGMPMRTSRTNAEGAVDVMVAEKGEKTIYVVPPHASFAAARVTARHAENGLRIIVPEGLATLRVQTKSSEDQPLPGISIALRHRGEPVPQGVLATMARDRKIALATNAAGELTIPALPAGDYEIAWRTRGTAPVPGWTKVTLGAGETKVTQTFAAGGK